MLRDDTLEKFLKTKGIGFEWTVKDLKKIIKENPNLFECSEETGRIKFSKTLTGRRYIQFVMPRYYID